VVRLNVSSTTGSTRAPRLPPGLRQSRLRLLASWLMVPVLAASALALAASVLALVLGPVPALVLEQA